MTENSTDPGTSAFQFASQFCFPRLSGTKGEKDAQELAIHSFYKLGLEPISEEFPASDFLLNLSRFALAPMGFLILLGSIFYFFQKPDIFFHSWLFIFFSSALIIGLGFTIYCQSAPGFLGWGKKLWTKNIFTRIGLENPEKDILLVVHYDSKSQVFPVWLRITIYYFAVLYSLFAIALGLYVSPLPLPICIDAGKDFFCSDMWRYFYYHPSWFWIFISAAVIDFLPLFNRLGNVSPGATDNAGAMGVILELARIFKEHPLEKSRIWFVFTGAEELGLLGARAFLEKHQAELDPRKTYVINFDPLGSGYKIGALSRLGFPGKKTDRKLNQMVKAIAEKNALPFRMIRFSIGFATDAYPFLKKGYQTINLGTFNRWIHTPRDTVDKLNPSNLGDYVRVTYGLIKNLDSK